MDEFYQKTYLMIVFKWSYYYTRKNMKNVRCDIIEDTKNYHTVNVIKLIMLEFKSDDISADILF